MRINVRKKDVEKMFDEGRFDDLIELTSLCYSKSASESIITFLKENSDRKSAIDLKQYIINVITKTIRHNNAVYDQKNFVPYYEKRSLFKKKIAKKLTDEESKYLSLFPSEEKRMIKASKEIINKESFDALKNIYEYDKDNYYTYIHRTASEVDTIEENGIRFGSSTSIDDMCQRMDNFYLMLREISICNDYKHSSGCFIIKVPRAAINEQSTPIFYEKDGDVYLNPRYVVAYTTVRGKNIVSVELNDEFKEVPSIYYNEQNVQIKSMTN